MRIFCVRHGETDWNADGRFQGQIDVPLNARGKAQALAAGAALKSIGFERIWSSPLSRASDTAKAIAEAGAFNGDILFHPDFTEIAHGLWEGRLASEVASLYPGLLEAWRKTPETVTMPEGERLEDVRARAVPAWEELSENARADNVKNILLVSHDATLRVLFCHLLGAPLSAFRCFQLANASVSVVEGTFGGWRFSLLGDAHHLDPRHPFERPEQSGI